MGTHRCRWKSMHRRALSVFVPCCSNFCFLTSIMPLDSHSYLVAQGWSGKGTGLREGAISRPVTVSQKKTLAGVGKDRDDAFPFWDQFSLIFYSSKLNLLTKASSIVSLVPPPNPYKSKLLQTMMIPAMKCVCLKFQFNSFSLMYIRTTILHLQHPI